MGVSTLVRIIEAGIDVFAQDGPSAGGTFEIAQKAGVAESTIFRRFDTKENLLRECFRTSLARSLDPSRFRTLMSRENCAIEHGFPHAVIASVKRWYLSMPVSAARLVIFTSLSSSRRWRDLGGERINQLIAVLTERIEQEGCRRCVQDLDAKAAATTLITTLLYRKSMPTAGQERNLATVETCIRQWIFGLFPEARQITST